MELETGAQVGIAEFLCSNPKHEYRNLKQYPMTQNPIIQTDDRLNRRRGVLKSAYVFYDSMEVSLGMGPDIGDITTELDRLVKISKIKNGVLCANIVCSTGSITTIEFEPGVVKDLKEAIDRLAPSGMLYAHEQAWHDGNGHSHIQAALLGPSITIAVRNGRMCLGTWQQVVVINHDNHSRNRPVEITITGAVSGQ